MCGKERLQDCQLQNQSADPAHYFKCRVETRSIINIDNLLTVFRCHLVDTVALKSIVLPYTTVHDYNIIFHIIITHPKVFLLCTIFSWRYTPNSPLDPIQDNQMEDRWMKMLIVIWILIRWNFSVGKKILAPLTYWSFEKLYVWPWDLQPFYKHLELC